MKHKYKVDKLYSYIITHDTGFSPNPFWGKCTLACCKPAIRRSIGKNWKSNHNIWIAGISPKRYKNEIVYIMRVDKCLTFPEYYEEYPEKRPDFSKELIYTRGDNIYKPIGSRFEQLHSLHSRNPFEENWSEHSTGMRHDLGGQYVLISETFIYFGREKLPLQGNLRELISGRGHRCRFSQEVLDEFEDLLNRNQEQLKTGTIMSNPHSWRNNKI